MVLNIGQQFALDFSGNVALYGRLMQVKHYAPTYSGTAYDQNYLTASGSTQYAYAMDFPVGMGRTGGQDFKLLEQGQIQIDDRKMFFNPSINFSGAHVKISISGTSITEIFAALPDGAIIQNVQGTDIYKKVYVRKLNTGSFPGEF
ncbi:MAG: hypothetical protein WC444_06795 [Candidatus Paceibacterota bacterium]